MSCRDGSGTTRSEFPTGGTAETVDALARPTSPAGFERDEDDALRGNLCAEPLAVESGDVVGELVGVGLHDPPETGKDR